MVDNLKIALCLSGQPRNSMFCFPYIYDAFLNNGYKVDVFIHTWNECRVIDLYRPKALTIETNPQDVVIKQVLTQLQIPAGISTEGHVNNNILQFYSLHKAFELVPADYDYIIRCRFDIIIQDKFNLKKVIETLQSSEYGIFIPDEIFNFGGYQDRVYIGNYSTMKAAMELILHLNEMLQQMNRWHPESFLKARLDSTGAKVYQQDVNHRIVRTCKVDVNYSENFNFLNL